MSSSSRESAAETAAPSALRQKVTVGVEKSPGDGGRDDGVADGDGADRRDQVPGWDVLQQEAAGARAERVEDVAVEVEGGEDEDPGVARRRDDAAGRLDPVHRGHPHVHQDDVGRELGRQRDRGGAVACLADHFKVLLRVEDHPKAETDQLLIVGQQYPDAHTGSSPPGTVRRVRTLQPPSGAGPVSTSPP